MIFFHELYIIGLEKNFQNCPVNKGIQFFQNDEIQFFQKITYNKGIQNFHLRKIFVDSVHTFIFFKKSPIIRELKAYFPLIMKIQSFHLPRKIFVDTAHTFIIFKMIPLIREFKIFKNPDQSIHINLINPDQSGSRPILDD